MTKIHQYFPENKAFLVDEFEGKAGSPMPSCSVHDWVKEVKHTLPKTGALSLCHEVEHYKGLR